MSESKRVMDQKICNVVKALMMMEIKDFSLDNLLPLILKECLKENIYFRFSFVENTCVLNIRDRLHENYEVNQRLYYASSLFDEYSMDDIKVQVLCNTFLLTKDEHIIEDNEDSSSKDEPLNIVSGDKPVPSHIRQAIQKLEAKGVPVTVEGIKNHLPLRDMGNDSRLKCAAYLKRMEASE